MVSSLHVLRAYLLENPHGELGRDVARRDELIESVRQRSSDAASSATRTLRLSSRGTTVELVVGLPLVVSAGHAGLRVGRWGVARVEDVAESKARPGRR